MSTDPTIAAAKARADASRQRLLATAAETKARLSPSVIASRTADGIKTRANRTANELKAKAGDGVETVGRNSNALMAIAGIVGLFVLRKPIRRLFRRPRPQRKAKPAQLPPPSPALQPTTTPEV
jgi:hypothetical protein